MTEAPRATTGEGAPARTGDASHGRSLEQAGASPQVDDSALSAADPRVDDALSRLAEVDALPLTEQVEVYADIHRRLAGVLSDPDSQA
jgi:hypothetical protein